MTKRGIALVSFLLVGLLFVFYLIGEGSKDRHRLVETVSISVQPSSAEIIGLSQSLEVEEWLLDRDVTEVTIRDQKDSLRFQYPTGALKVSLSADDTEVFLQIADQRYELLRVYYPEGASWILFQTRPCTRKLAGDVTGQDLQELINAMVELVE